MVQFPIAGRSILSHKGFFFSIRLEPIIGTDIDALLFAGEDLAPPIKRTSTLTVEKVFGTLGLGAQKSNLQKRTVSATAATRTDKLNPIFQLSHRAFEPGPIDLFEKPSGRFIKRSPWRKGQLMEKTHDPVSAGLSRMASFVHGHICVKTCLRIFLEKVKTPFLGKGELTDPLFPV